MISFEMKEHLQPVLDRLNAYRTIDPIKVALRVRDIVVEENERGLRDGVDATGAEMEPLKESTIKRGRGGFGPPLVPKFASSRLVTGFEAAVMKEGESGYIIRAGWPGLDWVRFHQTGTAHMAARPVAGFRPTTNAQIDEALRDFAAGFVRGND